MDSQQRYYLDALGIQLWERRDLSPPAAELAPPVVETPLAAPKSPAPTPQNKPQPQHKPQAVDDAIPAWLDEAPPQDEPLFDLDEGEIDESAFFSEAAAEPALPAIATLDWPALQQRVSDCTACGDLTGSRSQTVFGAGNPQADWLIIGEAPGEEEDRQGEPFVGASGELLNAMLHALGLQRQQVYITNMIKCRTPDDRDPQPQEVAACELFMQRQIALIQPKVILAMGRIAAQNLLKVDTAIGKLRGTVHQYDGATPLVATYHPAYLLRSPLEKRKAWADLCLARSLFKA